MGQSGAWKGQRKCLIMKCIGQLACMCVCVCGREAEVKWENVERVMRERKGEREIYSIYVWVYRNIYILFR